MSDSQPVEPLVFKPWMLLIPPLLIAPFVLPIPEALDKIYIMRVFGGFCHFTLPGMLGIFFYKVAGARGHLLKAMIMAFALSASTEFVQSLVGRHPRFIDAGIDLSGILFTIGLVQWREGRSRATYLPLLLFLAVTPWMFWSIPENLSARRDAAKRFPVIADFEGRTDEVLWSLSRNGVGGIWFGERVNNLGRVICLSGEPQDKWPGIAMRGVPRDWTGYEKLVFDAVIVKGGPAHMAVRIEDFHGTKDKTWCFTHIKLERTWTKHEIDLQELISSLENRRFRLDDLSLIVLYLVGVESKITVAIDNMALE